MGTDKEYAGWQAIASYPVEINLVKDATAIAPI